MPFIRLVLFCADVVHAFMSQNGPYIAAAISFYTLFAIFPLLLAVISVLSFMIGSNDTEYATKLVEEITDILPISSDLISREVSNVVKSRTITGVAGILGLLWASTAVFAAIRKGINYLWGVTKPRSFLKERLIDIGLALGAGTIMLFVMFSLPILILIVDIIGLVLIDINFNQDLVWQALTAIVYFATTSTIFIMFYRYLPNTKVKFSDVWIGGLVAALAFNCSNWGFVWYMRTFPSTYNLIYGSLGAVLALLSWVYVSALIVLVGALITSRYSRYVGSLEHVTFKSVIAGFWRVKLKTVVFNGN